MYRCTDCNRKYEIKPEYCDCGNNTFIQEVNSAPKYEPEYDDYDEPQGLLEQFYAQYPGVKKFVDSVDFLSGMIFLTCLILSVIFWNLIGAWNPPSDSQAIPSQNENAMVKNPNIPDIDQLWNSKPPQQDVVQQPVPVLPQQTIPEGEQGQEQGGFPFPFMNNQQPQGQQQAPQAQQPQPRAIQQPAAPRPKPRRALLNQELSSMSPSMKSYTNGLRQALFSQWAVGSVSGQGLCEVEFSVSKSGRLLGRRFSKQSDNDSLNNAVYEMLMNTPQYSAPPADYNGEKIRLSFYFNHGYYEVNYPKY